MAKYKLEDGTEIEAFTQEEVNAQIAELTKERDDAIDKAKNLEVAKQGAEKEKNENKTEVEQLRERLEAIESSRVENARDRFIATASGGDEETAKLIRAEYDNFNVDSSDEAAIEAAVLKASKLAVPEANPSALNDVANFVKSRGADASTVSTTSSLSDGAKDLGGKMGLTKEDFEKYGDETKTE